jgi:hypothetical protein
MVEGSLEERFPLLFHPEIDVWYGCLEDIATLEKAAADGSRIGSAGGEEVGCLPV